MKRPRKHIPLRELLASALASLLPQQQRDDLRERKVPAKSVIRLFTPDHIVLHAWGGVDKWFNIDMRLRGPELKAKDAADTSRAAKAVRIDDKWTAFTRAIQGKAKPAPASNAKHRPLPGTRASGIRRRMSGLIERWE